MKSIFIKVLLVINLLFIYNCKAQTTNDYINFYNDIVSKLNTTIPNKTQYYGQNFSVFYNELLNKNINIEMLGYDSKMDTSERYYILRLYFSDLNMWDIATENHYRFPIVDITFQNEIPPQIRNMVKQADSKWNANFVQFFSNMKIEKIEFIGMNGYDSQDRSLK